MTVPRKGSNEGLHGLPLVEGKAVRVTIDGDMPHGVVSWNADEGWADVVMWNDDGSPIHNGEAIVTQRVFGNVQVFKP